MLEHRPPAGARLTRVVRGRTFSWPRGMVRDRRPLENEKPRPESGRGFL